MPSLNDQVAIAVLQEQMKETNQKVEKALDKLGDIDRKIDALEGKFASKLSERIVYGAVALIILAFMSYLIAQAFSKQPKNTTTTTSTSTSMGAPAKDPPSQSFTKAGSPSTVSPTQPQPAANPPAQAQAQAENPVQPQNKGIIESSIRGLLGL